MIIGGCAHINRSGTLVDYIGFYQLCLAVQSGNAHPRPFPAGLSKNKKEKEALQVSDGGVRLGLDANPPSIIQLKGNSRRDRVYAACEDEYAGQRELSGATGTFRDLPVRQLIYRGLNSLFQEVALHVCPRA
jgi:hypothetical protein